MHRILLSVIMGFVTLTAVGVTGRFYSSELLASSSITSICQDMAGYMWIGTENGLCRFDGYKFTVYKNVPEDSTSLMFNIVNKVYCDKDGNLWVGTNTGLQRYDEATDRFIRYDSPLFERARISDICQLPDGRVLVGTAGFGLFQAQPATRTLTLMEDYKAYNDDRFFGHLLVENDGSLWRDGSKDFSLTRPGRRPQVFADRHDPPMSFADAGGRVLVMNRHQLSVYADGLFQDDYFDVSEVAALKPHYWTTMSDRQGNIYVGTRGNGLLWIPHGTRKVERYKVSASGINMNTCTIQTLFEDRQGNIWIGCWHKGLLVIPSHQAPFTSWNFSDQKHDIGNYVSSVCQGHDGITWCTVRDEGVFGFDADGQLVAHPTAPAWVEFIQRDRKGNYYVGTGTDIYTYNPANGQASKLLSFDCNMFNGMADDGQRLFFSAFGRGMLCYDTTTGRVSHYDQHTGGRKGRLCNDWIMSMTADRKGRLWIATTNGVCCYDGATDSFVGLDSGNVILEGKRCECLCETTQGDMLIGTMEGLYVWRHSTATVEVFPDAERLRGLTIGYIVQDRSGDVWCSTSMGIWHYRSTDGRWVSHVSGSGLTGKEYIANAGLYLPQEDRIFFANSDGITTFTPQQVKEGATSPGYLRLTGVSFGGKPVKPETLSFTPETSSHHFSFPFSDNVITMEFSLMNFLDAANTVLEYRLNQQTEWTSGSEGQNAITFTHLPIGTYQLEVRAIVGGSISASRVFHITIEAPWYRTTLAYILYAVGLMGIIVFLGLKWYRRIHRQLDEDKRQFIADTTEEIRSPLNLMMSPLEELRIENEKLKRSQDAASLQSSASNIQSAIEVIDSNARRIERYIKDIEVKGNDELLMERIMKCINDNISNSDLDVSLICKEAGISRSHLHRKMKEISGLSVHDFIQNIRMEQAARMLTEQKLNITQVAYAVGYSSQPSFSAAFRKHFGVSPTEYISQHQ